MSRLSTGARWLPVSVIMSAATLAQAVSSQAETAQKYSSRLETILRENVASFWYEKSLDREHGGYIINLGPEGQARGAGTKMIVTQARTVWLFARMARGGYRRQEYLDAAELGYRFLRDKMWDATNGGFYWEVDATGERQIRSDKHLYGQSFALYGLSEYYLASGKQEALDLATRLFDLIEEKAHDGAYGGYLESFQADWTPAPAAQRSPMGEPSGLKLMNTHLHLMEALTTFYRASKLPTARRRLRELIDIQSNAVVRKTVGACTDKYERDWTPRLDGNYARVSYGHDIENVWLLMDACEAAGVSEYPFADLYRTLFAYSLKYGYDRQAGGFFYTGAFNQPADDRSKHWWVQAEALVSSLRMYRFTKDPQYLEVFAQTLEFVEKDLVDWEHGEWHSLVTPAGTSQGDKANPWKAGYHNGRAMIECIAMLEAWNE
ncbi:MAG: AGE family epimerase/isomerase [Sedimentisphaerales bacterium]|nr:AGE family epimerase/isomerase [Sedimentisphaerales bacterium]